MAETTPPILELKVRNVGRSDPSYFTMDDKLIINAKNGTYIDFKKKREKLTYNDDEAVVNFGRKSVSQPERNYGKILFSDEDNEVGRDQFKIIVKKYDQSYKFFIVCTGKSSFTSLKCTRLSYCTLKVNDIILVGEQQILKVNKIKEAEQNKNSANPKESGNGIVKISEPIDFNKLVEISDIFIPKDWDHFDETTSKRRQTVVNSTIELENDVSLQGAEALSQSVFTFDSNLKKRINIGKSADSDIIYKTQQYIRQNHCIIEYENQNWVLKNTSEEDVFEKGTFLMIKNYDDYKNDMGNSKERELRDNDIIYVSKYEFLVKIY